VRITGFVSRIILWASSLHLRTPSGCIWCRRRSSEVTTTIQTTPSNGIPFFLAWSRNLIGFKSSPYNSIRMYLVLEEIIRGECHNPNNAFQWHSILLNLPGTRGYKPMLSWISKHKNSGTLASDFVCFVDDLRITEEGRWQVREASHAISL
jgi:hypothetical protein